MSEPEIAYHVEVGVTACKHCGEGQTFCIVGPNDALEATTFIERSDADEHAIALNVAYNAGFIHGKRS